MHPRCEGRKRAAHYAMKRGMKIHDGNEIWPLGNRRLVDRKMNQRHGPTSINRPAYPVMREADLKERERERARDEEREENEI